jgi:hypothetical protein
MGYYADYINTEYGEDPFNTEPDEIRTLDFIKILAETEKAWKLLLDDSDFFNPVFEWFPKSQCELDEKNKEIEVPQWLLTKKELD